MRNYKDETIARLCAIINAFEDNGCMPEDEVEDYRDIVGRYTDKFEEELIKAKDDNYANRYSNCYILKHREDGEVIVKAFEDRHKDTMMREVSKHICFSDCDDTFEIIKIVYSGREVQYTGWQPGMIMTYEYIDTGDDAWSEGFSHWDHQS